MTDQPKPANDMRELYAVQHAITDAGGMLTPAVHKALDALRETWDRELRRAQAEVFQYRTALQGTARAAVLPPPADRAAVLREEAALIRAHCPDHLDSQSAEGSWIDCHCDVADDMERRAADAQQPDTETPTPCDQPNACDPDTGELCATHEEEKAHADGEHEYCSVTCEVAMPTELMRNSLIAWAPPGGKGILAELERRAAAGAGRVADEAARP